MKHIYIFVGTTAEFIKVAPLIKELIRRKKKFKLIATGQNDIDFKEFEWYIGKVKPDIVLGKKNIKSSLVFFSLWAVKTFLNSLIKLDHEFEKVERSQTILIVHGDTVSSLIGSMVGKLLGVKIAHVESGLRSFNFLEPFPEEISRVIISRLADIHFCPNEWACRNLKNVSGEKINTQQNTLYDIYRAAISDKRFKKLKKKVRGKYYVLIMHRQEHVLFGREKSLEVVKFILDCTNMKCVLMTHEIAREMLKDMKSIKDKIVKLDRMPYFEFMHVLKNAEFVATDGGSNQEELYYMGKPALILRNSTERIEGLDINAALSKLDKSAIHNFIKNYNSYNQKKITDVSQPSKIIVESLI